MDNYDLILRCSLLGIEGSTQLIRHAVECKLADN